MRIRAWIDPLAVDVAEVSCHYVPSEFEREQCRLIAGELRRVGQCIPAIALPQGTIIGGFRMWYAAVEILEASRIAVCRINIRRHGTGTIFDIYPDTPVDHFGFDIAVLSEQIAAFERYGATPDLTALELRFREQETPF